MFFDPVTVHSMFASSTKRCSMMFETMIDDPSGRLLDFGWIGRTQIPLHGQRGNAFFQRRFLHVFHHLRWESTLNSSHFSEIFLHTVHVLPTCSTHPLIWRKLMTPQLGYNSWDSMQLIVSILYSCIRDSRDTPAAHPIQKIRSFLSNDKCGIPGRVYSGYESLYVNASI